MEPALAVAFVSVIGTVLVSILSVFVPVIVDGKKRNQHKEEASMERIRKSSLDLLSHLAHLRHWKIEDIEDSAGAPIQQVYSELRVKHYSWEQSIWSKIGQSNRDTVRNLRKEFESVHTPAGLKDRYSDISEDVLSIAKDALENDN